MAAPTADHNDREGDVDIVELALAILDEESRLWMTRQGNLSYDSERVTARDDLGNDAV